MRRLISLLCSFGLFLSLAAAVSAHDKHGKHKWKDGRRSSVLFDFHHTRRLNYGRRRSALAHHQNAERRALRLHQKEERRLIRARGLDRRDLAHHEREERERLREHQRLERRAIRQ